MRRCDYTKSWLEKIIPIPPVLWSIWQLMKGYRANPTKPISHLKRAIEIFRGALGEKASDTVDAVHQLAAVLPATGDQAGAERLYRQVLQSYLDLYGENDQRTGMVLYQMGVLYAGWNDIGNAESCLQRALGIYRQTLGDSHADTAAVLSILATVDARSGRFAKAEAECQPPWRFPKKNWVRKTLKRSPLRSPWVTFICLKKSSMMPSGC